MIRVGRIINDYGVDMDQVIEAINEHTDYEAERAHSMRIDILGPDGDD